MNPYATAAAFKQAVETRLRSSSSSGTDFGRRRQLLVFDRFLARITREVFTVAPDAEHPAITNEGMLYEGQRYRVTCTLAGKPYGQPFGLDIAFADPIFGEPDVTTAADVLGFAGIEPPTFRLYPLETHIAEKLHAYTLPRKRPNSRVKDLPDIALLAGVREIEAEHLRGALEQTFTSRKTHALRRMS